MDKEVTIGILGAVGTVACAWLYPPAIPGIFLGVISSTAMLMTYYSMSQKFKNVMCKYRILIDVGLAFMVPLWFGNFTATAVIAAAVNSVIVSLVLKYESSVLKIA